MSLLIDQGEPLMHHVGAFVENLLANNHPSCRVLVVAPDDDKRKAAIKVASIEHTTVTKTFAARVLSSSTVPFGYTPHPSAKQPNGSIDVSAAASRWESLFSILHQILKLPLSTKVDQFVAQFKRINSRKKNRPHPFHRAWDTLERIKCIFVKVAELLMDNYCVWRRSPDAQQLCRTKMEAYGLQTFLNLPSDTSVKLVSILWDTVVMVRWLIHMVKCVRVDRSPADFNPKPNLQKGVEPKQKVDPMDVDMTKEQTMWITKHKLEPAHYLRWCEYAISFCEAMGDHKLTLVSLPFHQRNVYLTNIIQSLRPYFYTWLQKHQTNNDHVSQVSHINSVMIKNSLPRTIVNSDVTLTIASLMNHPLVDQWIANSKPINPLAVAPPTTWAKLYALTSVPNYGEIQQVPKWLVLYPRLSKLCKLIEIVEQQFPIN